MDWNGAIAVVIAGAAGLLAISLIYRGGHALLNWLGDETVREAEILHSTTDQPSREQAAPFSVPYGQERLATQAERDDVDGRIARSPSSPPAKSVQL